MKCLILTLIPLLCAGCGIVRSSYHYTHGTQCLEQGDYDGAIVELKLAVELDPDMARNHNNLSYAYIRKGDVDKAWYHSRQAVLCPYQDDAGDVNFRSYCQLLIVEPKLNEPGTPMEEIRAKLGVPDIEMSNGLTTSYMYGYCTMKFNDGKLESCYLD